MLRSKAASRRVRGLSSEALAKEEGTQRGIMTDRINEFQTNTMKMVQSMFVRNKADHPAFEEREFATKGVKENFLYSEVKARGETIKIYIYDDGAQFNSVQVDRRFERYDFESIDELGETFVKILENYLFYPENYAPNRTIFMMCGDFFRSLCRR